VIQTDSNLTRHRIEKTKKERELVDLRTAILEGRYVNRERLGASMTDVFLACKQIVTASRNLTETEKADLFRSLASIPVTVDQEKVLAKKAHRTGAKAEIKP
jgi:hypothetical protein